jgi:hypothetical protein
MTRSLPGCASTVQSLLVMLRLTFAISATPLRASGVLL